MYSALKKSASNNRQREMKKRTTELEIHRERLGHSNGVSREESEVEVRSRVSGNDAEDSQSQFRRFLTRKEGRLTQLRAFATAVARP